MLSLFAALFAVVALFAISSATWLWIAAVIIVVLLIMRRRRTRKV